MREETRQDMMAAGAIGAEYDQAAKLIWRNREILAPLLKYSVTELRDESVESIMKLIDADSITSEETPVSDLPPSVVMKDREQDSATEKVITFDFKFKVRDPKRSTEKILVVLHIDVEFQNEYRPRLRDGKTYPIIKRAIYYVARDISSQLGRITEQTNYDDIEKVVSIWIINDDRIPKELKNTATRYYFSRNDFIGKSDEPESDYDLMEVVMIRRGEGEKATEPLLEYLNAVYEADIEKIDTYTPASKNPEFRKEVEKMPGMSTVIYDRGYRSGYGTGYDTGYDSGYGKGADSEQRQRIEIMLQKGIDPKEIERLCDYPLDLIHEVQNGMLVED